MAALLQSLVSFLGLQSSLPGYPAPGKTTHISGSESKRASTKASSTHVLSSGGHSPIVLTTAQSSKPSSAPGSVFVTVGLSGSSVASGVSTRASTSPAVSSTSLASATSSISSRSSAKDASGSAMRSRSSGSFAFNSSCPFTSIVTVTQTTTPLTTSTLYTNVTYTANGDDIGCYPYNIVLTSVNNTVTLSTTLTIVSTNTPASLQNVTATYTEPVPSGFVPVQDSLPGAVYVSGIGGPDPFNPQRRRAQAAEHRHIKRTASAVGSTGVASQTSCVSTMTSITTADTSTVTFTNTDPYITEFTCKRESTAVYVANGTVLGLTSPYLTITNTYTQNVTAYAATTTTTTTLTAPATTTTFYAACATNNFADYIQAANGSLTPIQAVKEDWTLINVVGLDTAYDCCAYNAANNGSVWLLIVQSPGNGICGIMSPANYPPGTCFGQSSPKAQFVAGLYTKAGVVGNGYCGQISSSALLDS